MLPAVVNPGGLVYQSDIDRVLTYFKNLVAAADASGAGMWATVYNKDAKGAVEVLAVYHTGVDAECPM